MNFFASRWRGQVPLRVMLWRDMLGTGTLINLVMTFLALIAIVLDAHIGLAVALHFAPLPYNIFLFAAIWRAPRLNAFTATISAGWLAAMTLL
ncbi:hypothetical protein [Kineobactrum salinum]|uniref:Uncharacterized protein n=1 Tax=Kineobactrum salinum TaxID=2708301 RepID=A0A6C0TXK0_9GAMM|nr:hypothetical protein [Kineobactrum salinum]QIB64358.1 hypothetical protein G3T16_01990 [Kineobactrum salinum]